MPTSDIILGNHSFSSPVWYGISNRLLFPATSTRSYLGALFETRAQIIQWREKDLSRKENRCFVMEGVRLARATGKLFLVNGDLELAAEAGADGVHLTSSQRPASAAQIRVARPSLRIIIGQSVHSREAAMTAIEGGCDYLLLGPVFDPLSKKAFSKPLGLSALRQVTQESAKPVFALGGLDEVRAEEVIAAGAAGVAGISWVNREVEQILRIYSSLGAPRP